MKHTTSTRNILTLAAVLLSGAAYAQMQATPEMTAEQAAADQIYRADTDIAVANLLDTIDLTVAPEPPRTGLDARGHLDFFGAPPGTPAPLTASAANARTAEDQAIAFITDNAAAFGIRSENVGLLNVRENVEAGRTYLRFQQTYADLEVFGAEIIVQLENGGVAAVFSDIMTDTWKLDTDKTSLTPNLLFTQAQSVALETVMRGVREKLPDDIDEEALKIIDSSLATDQEQELVIFDPSVAGREGEATLAWKVTVFSTPGPGIAEVLFVDAFTGATVYRYSLVTDAIDRTIYDDFNSLLLGPIWARGEGDLPLLFRPEVNNAYDFLGDTHQFYTTHHARPYLWEDQYTTANVRYCDYYLILNDETCPYVGASYVSPNSFPYYFAAPTMFVGDGFADDDVMAHEVTHGVTNIESGLFYQDESGAINESFSDVWGEFVDQTNGAGNDGTGMDWLIGEDTPVGARRDMADPIAFGDPDRMSSPNWYTGTADHGGVHTNSGVNNKLCYLLTDGGTFNGYTISGLGIGTIADLYYKCQVDLLSSMSDYAALYNALTSAAVNLGWSTTNKNNLEYALRAVEMSPVEGFLVRKSNGDAILRFEEDGNVVVAGTLFTGASAANRTPSPTEREFIVRNSAGEVVARASAQTGNIYIKGGSFPNQSSLTASSATQELVIRSSTGQVQSLIDENGNLKMRGNVL